MHESLHKIESYFSNKFLFHTFTSRVFQRKEQLEKSTEKLRRDVCCLFWCSYLDHRR